MCQTFAQMVLTCSSPCQFCEPHRPEFMSMATEIIIAQLSRKYIVQKSGYWDKMYLWTEDDMIPMKRLFAQVF